jgi:prepilin-type N-terminal cleavage/methylation domain-containing protein
MLKKRNEKGFTLIEIIAVLIILGILAAVAIPRYMGLQDEAKKSAANQALAEGIARVNMIAAKQILSSSTVPTASSLIAGLPADSTNAGDFALAFGTGVDTNAVYITASGTGGAVAAGIAVTGLANLPRTN